MGACNHPAYVLADGVLLCVSCGESSPSAKWPENVYGAKAVDQQETENKGRIWPPESKRIRPSGRRR